MSALMTQPLSPDSPSFLYQPDNHPEASPHPGGAIKRAILLVNLGTPDATDYWSMRRYLNQFLMDPRVVEAPRLLWWFIMQLFILPTRPFKSGHAYASIWDTAHNASPLRVITAAQTRKLQNMVGDAATVSFAMRYGQPSIGSQLEALQKKGINRIVVAPLYPQYSAATTGTVMDEVARYLLATRNQPSISTLPPYYDHPAYIHALAKSIMQHLKKQKQTPDVVVASFHGLPVEYCTKGDLYYCHSHKTARLLADALGMVFCRTVDEVNAAGKKPKLMLTFQSRFGKQVWLQPYTDTTLNDLARAGHKNVAVVCPGFAADCVETLEEIALAGRDSFLEAGGKTYSVVPCLNDSAEGMEMLLRLLTSQN